tara:strand:+ start:139 stop:459 length:321 start_codon:yes stop_codon:yes gene_type:complete
MIFNRKKRNKKVVCADGFSMSVQAFDGAYCSPRQDNAPVYTHVEIGYPNREESLIMSYAETPENPTESVYAYVPVETIFLVISKHGGMLDGEVPPGVPHYKTTRAI